MVDWWLAIGERSSVNTDWLLLVGASLLMIDGWCLLIDDCWFAMVG